MGSYEGISYVKLNGERIDVIGTNAPQTPSNHPWPQEESLWKVLATWVRELLKYWMLKLRKAESYEGISCFEPNRERTVKCWCKDNCDHGHYIFSNLFIHDLQKEIQEKCQSSNLNVDFQQNMITCICISYSTFTLELRKLLCCTYNKMPSRNANRL